MTPLATQTVREIALANPASVRVFESLGIDYCCGGKLSLSDACHQANVSEESVLAALANPGFAAPDDTSPWIHASTEALTKHIVDRHHQYVRRETPRLLALLEKVISRHGATHPEVISIRDLFVALSQELATHMLKEEQVLFPRLNELEVPADVLRQPIANMLADHDDAGALLARISALSGGYQPPTGACPTYVALYSGLAEFQSDLHQHVHLENNILFPRATGREKGE